MFIHIRKVPIFASMETTTHPLAHHHLSVDCVVFGFDGTQLKVLLVRRAGYENGETFHDMKLPGSLIYEDEDLDEAAERVLRELTGLKRVHLLQFKTFGSRHRTDNPKDVHWLVHAQQAHVKHIVTVAYLSMVKITHVLNKDLRGDEALWISVDEIPVLAFDHNQIIHDAREHIRHWTTYDPTPLFELLPRKFTAAQLRCLYELILDKPLDVRNFHKKMERMKYIVPLEEKEKDVPHRAARYYKFDKKKL